MKKFLVVLMSFFMSGCFGEIGSGIITKECTRLDYVNGMDINVNVVIKSQGGSVQRVLVTESYSGDVISSVLNSKRSEANRYQQEDGINVSVGDNIVIFDIDVSSVGSVVLENFNIVKEDYKMLKYYEDNGYTCK